MVTSNGLIVLSTLIISTIAAPQQQINTNRNREQIGTMLKNPVSLSYEELNYIIQTRSGIQSSTTRPRYLTPCSRAILACCRGTIMDPDCSEALACGAFFFDDNPCDDRFILKALESAKAFYLQFENRNLA